MISCYDKGSYGRSDRALRRGYDRLSSVSRPEGWGGLVYVTNEKYEAAVSAIVSMPHLDLNFA